MAARKIGRRETETRMSLSGKVIFMSGGSRGIGLAMAKRFASDGANVVIAAKTDKPHPKLEGTIHTAAAEIDAAGGNCLLYTSPSPRDQRGSRMPSSA